jgi:hypothetical protein
MSKTKQGIDFRADLPPGWQNQTVYHFRGPEIDGMPHTLVVTVDRDLQEPDIVRFARRQTDPIKENLQGLEILKDEVTTIENGNETYEFVYKWIPGEDVRLYQKYVFVIKAGMGFTISSSFNKRSFKMLAVQMKDLIENILPGTYESLEED